MSDRQHRLRVLRMRARHEQLYEYVCAKYNYHLLVPLGRGVADKRSEHVNWLWIFATVET